MITYHAVQGANEYMRKGILLKNRRAIVAEWISCRRISKQRRYTSLAGVR
ncbi:MAG: hypothetical protein A4E65_03687 [Syntrophorhabdus sp. PtaU1.Bin153]|nr:MAG: hypothetical protein A4E65_03687 [Syntrophorhabdus sp. PtaU1.Bin153]